MLTGLVAAGRRTVRADVGIMREPYIYHPSIMRCSLASVDNGKLLGVQSLIYAIDGNLYAPLVGWNHWHPCRSGRSKK
jgi:hypothetical protein